MEPKFKYVRLSDEQACIALAVAICKLDPRKDSYRAANYVMTIFYPGGVSFKQTNVMIDISDLKQTFKHSVVLTSTGFSVTATIINPETVNFSKLKSALRRMLGSVALTDASI